MTALTFDTRETLLTLDQNGSEETSVITLQLSLSTTPSVYVSSGQLLQKAKWTMLVRARAPGAGAQEPQPGTLSYTNNDGKIECLVSIQQSQGRFCELLGMFKGGHASEIAIVADGMEHQDDYSSHWNTDLNPMLKVLRVSFEFPLPQSEA